MIDLGLRVNPDIPEQGEEIQMERSFKWRFTKQKVKRYNWGVLTEF